MPGERKFTNTIHVAVRVRPILQNYSSTFQNIEQFSTQCVFKRSDQSIEAIQDQAESAAERSRNVSRSAEAQRRALTFTFDHVFDELCAQKELYEKTTQSLMHEAIAGNNVTVFAYGPTGTGKTHTIFGDLHEDPKKQRTQTDIRPSTGLFLRAINDLLRVRTEAAKKTHITLKVSVMEIYNEKLQDLLAETNNAELRIVMDDDEAHVPNCSEVCIDSLQDAIDVFQRSTARRHTRDTACNLRSSRSHCLFMLDISQSSVSDASKPTAQSRVIFADLAGCEKLKQSGTTGDGAKEAIKINSSLTALGNVIHALHNAAVHIPYRNSVLTRLLRTSFQPHQRGSRILLLATLAPTTLTAEETLSTCYFANKVKNIAVGVLNTKSGIDSAARKEYYDLLRHREILLAELRLAEKTCGYKPVLRSVPNAMEAYFPEGRYTSPLGTSLETSTPQKNDQSANAIGRQSKTAVSVKWTRKLPKTSKLPRDSPLLRLARENHAKFHERLQAEAIERFESEQRENSEKLRQRIEEAQNAIKQVEAEIVQRTKVNEKEVKTLKEKLSRDERELNALVDQTEKLDELIETQRRDVDEAANRNSLLAASRKQEIIEAEALLASVAQIQKEAEDTIATLGECYEAYQKTLQAAMASNSALLELLETAIERQHWQERAASVEKERNTLYEMAESLLLCEGSS